MAADTPELGDDAIKTLREKLQPLTVVRLRAHWVDDPEIGDVHALLDEMRERPVIPS
jgi:hypothetical protein